MKRSEIPLNENLLDVFNSAVTMKTGIIAKKLRDLLIPYDVVNCTLSYITPCMTTNTIVLVNITYFDFLHHALTGVYEYVDDFRVVKLVDD